MLIYFAVSALAVALVAGGRQLAAAVSATRPVTVAEAPAEPARWTIPAVVATGLMVAFAGLRSLEVGFDTRMYFSLFAGLEPTFWREELAASPQESGYTLLSMATKAVTDHPHAIFWVCAVGAVVPVVARLLREGRSAPFALALFLLLAYYASTFNVMRQGVAVALLFYADRYLDTRDWKRYAAFAAVAASIHVSAIIAVAVLLVVRHVRPSAKLAVATLGVSALAAVTITRFSGLADLLGSLNARYAGYLTAEESSGVGTYLNLVFKVGLVAYALYLAKRTGTDPGRHATYMIVGVVFMALGTASVSLSRMEPYFGIFACLVLARLTEHLPNRWLHRGVIAAACAVYFTFYLMSFGQLTPYATYL